MKKVEEINSCLLGEELVAYIYDEISSASRETFERHLLDCNGCTAELADISLSRLGVYEWNRDEFIPLETPQFVIPYEPKEVATPKLSWVDALRGFFASPMRLVTAGGALAAIAFAVTFGFQYGSAPNNRAAATPGTITAQPSLSNETVKSVADPVVADQREVEIQTPAPKRESRPTMSEQRIQATQIKNVRMQRRATNQTASAQSAPRLGNFVETEDKSLRLADLVADIDTKE